MSILNNDIRAWWIQKSDSCNIANKVEFCDFKPTVHDKGYDWIRVISLDDFHKQTNINITRWIEVCRELQKLQEQNKILREALEFVIKESGSSTNYNKMAREALAKVKE